MSEEKYKISSNPNDEIKLEEALQSKITLKRKRQYSDKERIEMFNKAIEYIWKECHIKDSHPWDNKNAVGGQVPGINMWYDKDELANYIPELTLLINQIPEVTNIQSLIPYYEIGVLRQRITFLLSMAKAAQVITQEQVEIYNEEILKRKVTLV